MSQRFYNALLFVAMSVLFHAAYSVTEWRHFARNKEGGDGGLFRAVPVDIAIEVSSDAVQ